MSKSALQLTGNNNTEFVIVLFNIFVIGFAITGLASFNNLADIAVAFLTLVLFICLCLLKNIILCEKDEIINDQNMVAECFNDFFINVA
jgi:hypothetical protein